VVAVQSWSGQKFLTWKWALPKDTTLQA